MLSRITRAKLTVFAAITILALTAFMLDYIRLPQQLGIGRYQVNVDLAEAGGLYPQAAVTFRGVEVGKVTGVDLAPDGTVVAHLEVDDGTRIPKQSVAEVHSQSVIGEQYLNFLPMPHRTTSAMLRNGETVPESRTSLPPSTNALLTSVDGLLKSVPQNDLRTFVHELGLATQGSGSDLQRLVDSSRQFQQTASANLPQTTSLIDQLAPVLATQRDLEPDIRSFATNLGSLSGELKDADAQIRGVLASGAPFMQELSALGDDLRPVLPGLLSDLANTGQVLREYRDNIEHILIVVPALLPTANAVVPPDRQTGQKWAANLWFKIGLDPPVCTQGFEDAGQMRDPSDLSPAPISANSWCKVAAGDPRAARGARNQPCPNGGTGATAAECGLVFDRSVVGASAPPQVPGADATPSASSGGASPTTASPVIELLPGTTTTQPGTLADLLEGLLKP